MKSGLQVSPVKITLNCSILQSFILLFKIVLLPTTEKSLHIMFIRARSIQPKFPTGPTEKTGPPQKLDQFFRNFSGRNRTDPLSFGPKFPVILVEWIAPLKTKRAIQVVPRLHLVTPWLHPLSEPRAQGLLLLAPPRGEDPGTRLRDRGNRVICLVFPSDDWTITGMGPLSWTRKAEGGGGSRHWK